MGTAHYLKTREGCSFDSNLKYPFPQIFYVAHTFSILKLFFLFTKSALNVLHFSSGEETDNTVLLQRWTDAAWWESVLSRFLFAARVLWRRLTFSQEFFTKTATTGNGSPGRSCRRSVGKDKGKWWRGLPRTEPQKPGWTHVLPWSRWENLFCEIWKFWRLPEAGSSHRRAAPIAKRCSRVRWSETCLSRHFSLGCWRCLPEKPSTKPLPIPRKVLQGSTEFFLLLKCRDYIFGSFRERTKVLWAPCTPYPCAWSWNRRAQGWAWDTQNPKAESCLLPCLLHSPSPIQYITRTSCPTECGWKNENFYVMDTNKSENGKVKIKFFF